MGISFINGTSFTETVAGQDATLTPANAVGNLLVLKVSIRSSVSQPSILTVSDTGGNTWQHSTERQQSGSLCIDTYYSVTGFVSGTLTIHSDKATNTIIAECLEFNSTIGWAASVADILLENSGPTSTALTSGTSSATAQNSEVAVGMTSQFGSNTFSGQTAGFTVRTLLSSAVTGVGLSQQTAWQILSSTATQIYAATASASAIWGASVSTFKEAIASSVLGSGNANANRGGNMGANGGTS